MAKRLSIRTCGECPRYEWRWGDWSHFCRKEQRELPDSDEDEIPQWCPLPDDNEGNDDV